GAKEGANVRPTTLSCAQASKLVRLDAGQSLPRSELPKSILAPLQEGGAVHLEKSGSSYVVRGLPGKLASFVAQHWGIRDLEKYARAVPGARSRAMLADVAGDSKALPNRPFDGVFIRSFNNCFLADRPLSTTPPGSAVLICLEDLPKLTVESKYIIAVENAE